MARRVSVLREGRNSGFLTTTVGGAVLGVFAMPLRRRLERVELRVSLRARKPTLPWPS